MLRCSAVLFILFLCVNIASSKYDNVEHTIVIVLENWSYDALFGTIEKANGLAKATVASTTQLDRNDHPYTQLPQVQRGVPTDLPNKPFDLSPYIGIFNDTVDLTHAFYTEQMQINGGKMNKFVAYGSSKGLTMSYYDYRNHYLVQLAENYTMFDAWHHALFGGSWGNHIWLICPLQPVFPNAPPEIINNVNEQGYLVDPDKKEVAVTPDYYAVNTIYSVQPPTPAWANSSRLLPLQNYTTIGDLMTEAGISWAWYSGGYNDAMAGHPDITFQYHHQPFIYFKNYAVGTPGRQHLKDYEDLLADIKNETLPQVSFYKPLGRYNMHPNYSIIAGESEEKLREVIEIIQNSKYWPNTVIFITFDEHGGRWDHVTPPKIDRWGPGSRIPTLIVSPLVKQGYVDSTYHDSTSIMRFIQERYGLSSIGTRDKMQNGFDNVFIDEKVPLWVIAIFVFCALVIVGAVILGVVFAVQYFSKKPFAYVNV